ncbi:hypothetical protein HMPREF0541_02360 [Lacticaseibacillus rhamnosus ATCC 21052]|nr:hypothetical protein HMPREF0541_02360 [Lacticaseibacillus rhamnosus ATCC 21052]
MASIQRKIPDRFKPEVLKWRAYTRNDAGLHLKIDIFIKIFGCHVPSPRQVNAAAH